MKQLSPPSPGCSSRRCPPPAAGPACGAAARARPWGRALPGPGAPGCSWSRSTRPPAPGSCSCRTGPGAPPGSPPPAASAAPPSSHPLTHRPTDRLTDRQTDRPCLPHPRPLRALPPPPRAPRPPPGPGLAPRARSARQTPTAAGAGRGRAPPPAHAPLRAAPRSPTSAPAARGGRFRRERGKGARLEGGLGAAVRETINNYASASFGQSWLPSKSLYLNSLALRPPLPIALEAPSAVWPSCPWAAAERLLGSPQEEQNVSSREGNPLWKAAVLQGREEGWTPSLAKNEGSAETEEGQPRGWGCTGAVSQVWWVSSRLQHWFPLCPREVTPGLWWKCPPFEERARLSHSIPPPERRSNLSPTTNPTNQPSGQKRLSFLQGSSCVPLEWAAAEITRSCSRGAAQSSCCPCAAAKARCRNLALPQCSRYRHQGAGQRTSSAAGPGQQSAPTGTAVLSLWLLLQRHPAGYAWLLDCRLQTPGRVRQQTSNLWGQSLEISCLKSKVRWKSLPWRSFLLSLLRSPIWRMSQAQCSSYWWKKSSYANHFSPILKCGLKFTTSTTFLQAVREPRAICSCNRLTLTKRLMNHRIPCQRHLTMMLVGGEWWLLMSTCAVTEHPWGAWTPMESGCLQFSTTVWHSALNPQGAKRCLLVPSTHRVYKPWVTHPKIPSLG